MKRLLSLFLTLMTPLGGCKVPVAREIVFVPDISKSIDADAERQMFAAIEDVAQHLRRGDTLTIVPITGNAKAELQGRTLRYSVPTEESRQAYDADLRTLHDQIKNDLVRLQTDALAHPGEHTDIIGSIRIAMKEFSLKPSDKRLIVLSDFIQDDSQFDFRKDNKLAGEAQATALAKCLIAHRDANPVVTVILGRLRSNEFSSLTLNRQRAIEEFWAQVMFPADVEADGTEAALRALVNN